MRRDSKKLRGERPFLLISLRHGTGVEDLMQWVNSQLALLPKTS
jgi:urease accessory protein